MPNFERDQIVHDVSPLLYVCFHHARGWLVCFYIFIVWWCTRLVFVFHRLKKMDWTFGRRVSLSLPYFRVLEQLLWYKLLHIRVYQNKSIINTESGPSYRVLFQNFYITLYYGPNRPLALAAIYDETCTRERLPLVESRAQCVHACICPLFYIKNGGKLRIVSTTLVYLNTRDQCSHLSLIHLNWFDWHHNPVSWIWIWIVLGKASQWKHHTNLFLYKRINFSFRRGRKTHTGKTHKVR